MRRSIALLVVLSLTAVALAADDNNAASNIPGNRKQLTTKEATKEFTETFLRTFVASRPYDAFALFRAAMPDAENDIEASRESTERLIDSLRPSYGRIIGYELLDTKTLGSSFVRYEYLLKFEKNAIHCRADYYHPSNVWLPVGVWFTDDLSYLFDNVAK